jgi:hypothetical protein
MIRNGELIPEDSQVFKESVKDARVFEDDIISNAAIQESLKSVFVSFPFFLARFQRKDSCMSGGVTDRWHITQGCTYMDSYLSARAELLRRVPAQVNQG